MVVYIKELAVTRRQWLDEKAFNDGVSLCQSIPGATAMQTAAYVGLKTGGIAGAFASYAGFGLPAFVLMAILSFLYTRYHNLPNAVSLFSVLQVIVVALIANATFLLGKGMAKRPAHMVVGVAAALLFGLGVSPFLVILCGAGTGALILRDPAGAGTATEPGEEKQYRMKPILLLLALFFIGIGTLYLFDAKLFRLALTMLKVDLFAFGGGFAALPLMLHEVVYSHGWMTGTMFMDGIALGQITPGPIVITATFVGYMLGGVTGALTGTVAIFTPSFLVLLAAAPLFDRLKGSPFFVGATKGIFATFLGLLLYMTVKFGLLVPWDAIRIGVALLSMAALVKKVDTFYVVLAGALASLFLFNK